MKKAILLACLLIVGCSGSTTKVQSGPFEMNIPSGWKVGVAGDHGQAISIKVYSQKNGYSVESVITDVEKEYPNPARFSNTDGSVGFSATCNLSYPSLYFETESVSVSCRDLEVEAKRIQKTDTTSNVDPLEVAKINLRESALFYDQAKKSNLLPQKQDIENELETSYKEANKNGTTKEQFLTDWGITEEEFRNIIEQKLAYVAILRRVTASAKSDLEYKNLATKYKNDIMSTADQKIFDIVPQKVVIRIREVDGVIAVITGFGQDYDFNAIANSLRITSSFVDGQLFLAGLN